MADEVAAGEKHSAQVVGNAFVQQYYQFLKDHPEHVHRFYNDSSVVNWPAPDGSMKSAISTKEINELIMSSEHKDYTIQITTADAQDTLREEVLVVVTGVYISKENLTRKSFAQTFVLARQDKGAIFVVNDILRFVDVHESTSTAPLIDNTEGKASIDPLTLDSGCSDALDDNQPSQKSIPTQSEAMHHETSKDVPAAADQSNTQSGGVVNEVVSKPPLPPSQPKDDTPRRTYASMLTKEGPISSPKHGPPTHKIERVATNANQQPAPTPTPKAPAPSTTADKPQVQAATRNAVSNVSSPNNGTLRNNNNIHQPAKGIYLRGLPYDVTKNGVLEVIKKFGQVKLDDIQFIRYEDGFCCGFVEFQTADSARNAVEVGKVEIGGKEVHISYKKKSGAKGNNGPWRYSSGREEGRNGNFNGRQDGDRYRNEYRRQNDNQSGYAGDSQVYHHRGEGWFSNGRNGEAAAAYRKNNQKRNDIVTR